ncbi:MAG: hypothetical protein AAF721_17410, partial [Myxococcota bacterium]
MARPFGSTKRGCVGSRLVAWSLACALLGTSVLSRAAVRVAPDSDSPVLRLERLAIEGRPSDAFRASMRAGLMRGLSRGEFVVVGPQDGAAFELLVTVVADDRDYDVVAIVRATDDGRELARLTERCELCGLGDVEALMESLGAAA